MTLQTIPLDKLTLAEGNVRRTAAAASLDELAASIEAHGLLQNLSVREVGPCLRMERCAVIRASAAGRS